MGMLAWMTVVPKLAFKRHRAALAELEVPDDAASFSLDKAWLQFHCVLREMPKPLCLAISGDCPCVSRLEGGLVRAKGEPPLDDEEEEAEWEAAVEDGDDWSCYLGYFTPGLVKKLDRAISKISEEELLAAMKAAGWSLGRGGRKYYGFAFGELKRAYQVAAAKGDALSILIT